MNLLTVFEVSNEDQNRIKSDISLSIKNLKKYSQINIEATLLNIHYLFENVSYDEEFIGEAGEDLENILTILDEDIDYIYKFGFRSLREYMESKNINSKLISFRNSLDYKILNMTFKDIKKICNNTCYSSILNDTIITLEQERKIYEFSILKLKNDRMILFLQSLEDRLFNETYY